jgi:hypothetical protein
MDPLPDWPARTIAVLSTTDGDPHAIPVSAPLRAVAFTARGRARIRQEPMDCAPDYAAVEIEVEHVDDHRQAAFVVEAGVDRRWIDAGERRALGERVKELRDMLDLKI